MEMPARATPRSEEMTTGLLASRRSGHARDIRKQILRFAQNDKRSANDSLAPSLLAPPPSPLAGEGRGEGALLRDVLTLSFRLGPSCHSRRFSRRHSGLSLPVIPDVINRESKAGVRRRKNQGTGVRDGT